MREKKGKGKERAGHDDEEKERRRQETLLRNRESDVSSFFISFSRLELGPSVTGIANAVLSVVYPPCSLQLVCVHKSHCRGFAVCSGKSVCQALRSPSSPYCDDSRLHERRFVITRSQTRTARARDIHSPTSETAESVFSHASCSRIPVRKQETREQEDA